MEKPNMTYCHIVQYYETDQMACVHHSNYIRWFEEARTDFLDKIGYSYARMEREGVMSPVLKAEAEYKKMVQFGDVAYIDTKVLDYSGTRITFGYMVRLDPDGVCYCQGITRHCFITKDGRPVILKRYLPEMDQIIRTQLS